MYCFGWYFLREINCKQDFIVRDGPLFFWRGAEGSKIFTWKHFFLRLRLQKIGFVSLSSCKYCFFTCIQFISVFTASANNLFQNFSPPPPPRQKHNGQSLSFLINKRLLKLEKIVNIITIIIIFVIIIVLAYYKNQIKKTCWQRQHEEN